MKNDLPDNVIEVDFNPPRYEYDDPAFNDVIEQYREIHGRYMQVLFEEDENYYILSLHNPDTGESFVIDCGWTD